MFGFPAKHIIKLFHILHYIILGASNERGIKNRDFRFISEMNQDRTIDQMQTKRLINVSYKR